MSYVDNFAVPGYMQPGAAWPGEPSSVPVPIPAALLVMLGQPYLTWTTGPVSVG